jgi:hypothetical protein
MKHDKFTKAEIIKKLIDRQPVDVLAEGYMRYEAIRTLGPNAFHTLWTKNIETNASFDELVDDFAIWRENT